jgi:hypothetical protein
VQPQTDGAAEPMKNAAEPATTDAARARLVLRA